MIKSSVRRALRGRLFVCFVASVLPAILPWIMQTIPLSYGVVNFIIADVMPLGLSIPMLVLSFLATTFVTDPMTVRVGAFFLRLNRDAEKLPSPLSVCDCFGPGYLRLVSGMLSRALRILVWSAVPLCVGALIPGTWELVTHGEVQYIQLNDLAYVFFVLALAANIYRGLAYAMVPYLLADVPDCTASEALRRSAAIMKGRMLELLVVELSFFGWLFLTVATFAVAGVYTYPYIEGTMAGYYIAFTETTNPLEQRRHAA